MQASAGPRHGGAAPDTQISQVHGVFGMGVDPIRLACAAGGGGYQGAAAAAAGVPAEVAGLLGQGMTAAGLQAILQQQSHRVPPEMVRLSLQGLPGVHFTSSLATQSSVCKGTDLRRCAHALGHLHLYLAVWEADRHHVNLQMSYFAAMHANLKAAEGVKPEPSALNNQQQAQMHAQVRTRRRSTFSGSTAWIANGRAEGWSEPLLASCDACMTVKMFWACARTHCSEAYSFLRWQRLWRCRFLFIEPAKLKVWSMIVGLQLAALAAAMNQGGNGAQQSAGMDAATLAALSGLLPPPTSMGSSAPPARENAAVAVS